MKNSAIKVSLVTFFITIVFCTAYAGDSTSRQYPVAVLVELKTEQSRIAALTKDKRYAQLEELNNDIIGERDAMVRDFKDNFDYCPVYYFMDTDIEFITKKQFAGKLLDANLKAIPNNIINSESNDYVIVYFGYPAVQPHHQKIVKDSLKYLSNSGEPMGIGLIINNDKMQQISYLYSLGYHSAFLSKREKKYAYLSKHFSIEYFPFAKEFNTKLKNRKNSQKMKINRKASNVSD